MRDEFLWVEKYRPKTVDECILPKELKNTFQGFINQKNIPNLILTGPSGVGKTTVARAILEELNCDYMMINGSMSGNIDTLRTEIRNFASTVSFKPGRKFVILDEADYLNAQSTQPALRGFIEEFSSNCGFILTCNYLHKIIKELHSRCSVIHFLVPHNERKKLVEDAIVRVLGIVSGEDGVSFVPEVVAKVVIEHFPDMRRSLNELQRYAAGGSIDSGILVSMSNENLERLFSFIKENNFKDMRTWVAANQPDATTFYRQLYDGASKFAQPGSIPQLIVIIADYQFKQAFVADSEINLVACLTEIMADVELL